MYKILSICFIFLSYINFAFSASINADYFTLDNNMRVVVITNNKVSAISHMVWYNVGSIDEIDGNSGIAHLLEHLMFKGTDKYRKGEFSKLIAKSGGNDNAFTSNDYTAYYQNISADKLELVMQLESDRMKNMKISKEDVFIERDVVLEERKSRIDNKPLNILTEQMRRTLYLNQPYGRPLIGWEHEIENLSLKEVEDFYKKYYMPNNAILIVSGDITREKLEPLANKYYGTIKPGKLPERIMPKEPKHKMPRRIKYENKNVKNEKFIRFYITPSQNSEDKKYATALMVLSYILGESDTSLLYKNLVLDKKLAASASTYYDDLKIGNSAFYIYITPNDNVSLAKIEAELDLQIKNIIDSNINEEILKRAKNSLISQVIYAREDLKSLAYFYGQVIATNTPMDYIDNWQKNINAVSLEEIKEAANKFLVIEGSVTGYLLKGQGS